MSSTRYADSADENFHQEKFCSSDEYNRGLLANLVAKRCQLLPKETDRDLVWSLQSISHREGLESFAAELLKAFPGRLGSKSMRHFGMDAGGVYDASQVKLIREEIPGGKQKYPLAGELRPHEQLAVVRGEKSQEDFQRPEGYPVARFLDLQELSEKLIPQMLRKVCTDPAAKFEDFTPWYFRDFIPSVREHLANRSQARQKGFVLTEIGSRVLDAIEYGSKTKRMVLIEGLSRTGKSEAARHFCEMNPGKARYVQVPSTNDDIGFFRRIAESIGAASALSFKGVQIRERVESALQTSKLTLVLDEAHYCWPQSNRREALPARINWLMTALVNYGVTVVLVTTPQFSRDQKLVEKKTGWTSEQFLGRIGHFEKLPDKLSDSDLAAIVRHHFPHGGQKAVDILMRHAKSSREYLFAIEKAATRATYLANNDGRENPTIEDLKATFFGSAGVGTIPQGNPPAAAPSLKRGVTPAAARPLIADIEINDRGTDTNLLINTEHENE